MKRIKETKAGLQREPRRARRIRGREAGAGHDYLLVPAAGTRSDLPSRGGAPTICSLCIATNYTRKLYTLCLLKWTLDDVTAQEFAFYRRDVTCENFNDVLHDEIDALLSRPKIA